ncbi:MAG: mechanosensitive ion channel family protein [Candidatus Omnitrophica bacterium]|nr:mechanosensitive ion channel family protein [Candidatus Omnitrophota bacterium]
MPFELTPHMLRVFISATLTLLIYFISLAVIQVVNRKMTDLKRRHTARKTTLYIATFLAIGLVGVIWIENLRTVSVVISVIGAGIVVALGDVFLSVAGWFLILIRRPFDAGDRIQIGDLKGDVIDVRLFQTSLLEIGNWVNEDQSTGRIVHISNNLIFKNPVYNFTKGFEYLWDEIKIVVTFESDWKKAEEIMLERAQHEAQKTGAEMQKRIRKMAERYLIFYEKLTPIVYTKIVGNGIELSLRYLTEVKKRRQCQDCLNRAILDDFGKNKSITFAYTTYRIVK